MAYFTQTLSGTFPEWNSQNGIPEMEFVKQNFVKKELANRGEEELWQV